MATMNKQTGMQSMPDSYRLEGQIVIQDKTNTTNHVANQNSYDPLPQQNKTENQRRQLPTVQKAKNNN